MTKGLLPFLFFFFALSLSYGQNAANPAARLDDAVKTLAADINKKIPAGENQKVAVGAWTHHDSAPAFSFYWAAQLTEELTNIPGRSFVLAAGGPVAADWTLSGEIIEAAGVIRVYTRLIRSGDRAIAASFHADFEPDDYLAEMLSGGGSSSSSRGSSVARDSYEGDSFENPLAVEIAEDSGGPVINRTIHTESDSDFFLLVPDRDGRLTMETTGDMDTLMKLYDASETELASDDDGGSGSNARIRHRVRSGERYIARVRSYQNGTGRYGFRAWITESAISADEYEYDNDRASAKEISIGTPQQHTFTTGSDVDWVRFSIDRTGRYVINARGVDSTQLDTLIELYDTDLNLIEENDDGGDGYASRLSVYLQPGTYYLKAKCLNDEPDEPYTLRIDAE